MSRIGLNSLAKAGVAARAATTPLMALALLTFTPASAQDAPLPSVSDYRLPSARPSATAKPQGPVDSDAPVVRPAAPADTPDEAPAPAAEPSSRPAPAGEASRATPAARPVANAAERISTTRGATSSPAQSAPAPTSATPSAAIGQSGSTSAIAPEAASGDIAADAALPAPPAWHIHSASESLAERALGIWPWLAALAFVLGAALMFLVQRALLSRQAERVATDAQAWERETLPAAVPPPAPEPHIALTPVAARAPDAELEEPVETLDDGVEALSLLSAEPTVTVRDAAPASAPPARSIAVSVKPEPPVLPARPALDLLVNPLDVTLAARRMSATLMNTVLNYELVVTNLGTDAFGPIGVAGDMIGAHASLPTRSQLEIAGQQIEPLHRIESLAPGDSVTLTGELRLPLSAIKPIRSGTASLFVPLARFRVEALRNDAPPLVVTPTFVIGESPSRPGAALKPFRLDLGPRLYSQLGQREVALSA